MENVTKAFNPDAYRENDAKARKYSESFFKRYGIEARNNSDRYGIDQLLYKDGSLFGFCECEIKWYLEEGRFKWDTLNILYRKKKYAELESSKGKPVFFCLFSPDGTRLALTKGRDILSSRVKELPNRAVGKGELFFDVPLSLVRMIDLSKEEVPTDIFEETKGDNVDYNKWKSDVLMCKNCNLGQIPNKIKVIGRGPVPCKIMVVGESPGEQEELRGIPFCGQAGDLLNKICKIVGFDRETDFYITNAVKCHPPGNKTTNEHVRACNSLFTQELDFVKPDIIVTLGNFATEMFGIDMKITECHGKEFAFMGVEDIKILPIYHPAYVLYGGGQMAKDAIIEDFVKLREMVWGVGYKEYKESITVESEILGDIVIGKGGYSLTEAWSTVQEMMRGDV